MMEKAITRDNCLVYMECNVSNDTNKHFDLLISKPEVINENEYKCVYSIIGEEINITFPVYAQDSFQALLTAVNNAYSTIVANNLNTMFYETENNEFKRFYKNYIKYIKKTPLVLRKD